MHGFVLQPWITLRGTSTTTSIAQSERDYLDLAAYQDYVAWLEVSEMTTGGAIAQLMLIETAPFKDEALFGPTGGLQTVLPIAPGVSTVTNRVNAPLASQIPLARYVRWRVEMPGASSAWSVTFQVHVAAHAPCLRLP